MVVVGLWGVFLLEPWHVAKRELCTEGPNIRQHRVVGNLLEFFSYLNEAVVVFMERSFHGMPHFHCSTTGPKYRDIAHHQ